MGREGGPEGADGEECDSRATKGMSVPLWPGLSAPAARGRPRPPQSSFCPKIARFELWPGVTFFSG